MKLGISTASFFGKVPTENCFGSLREMGVPLTEVFLSSFSEYEKGFVDALKSRLTDDVKVHSVHALSSTFEGLLFSQSRRVKDDAEQFFRKVCYAGNALGAKYYTFHGPSDLKKSPSLVDVGTFAERLEELASIASTYGLYIAVENVHYCCFSTPDAIKALLKSAPSLWTTLDVKHAYYAGYDPLRYLDAADGRLATVHVADIGKDDATVLPGSGKLNFERLFREIDKRELDPAVIIEVYPRDFTYNDELKQGYMYLKNMIDNL